MPLRYVNLPTGILRLQGTDRALKEVRLVEVAGPEEAPEALSRCARELTEYFAGTRLTTSLYNSVKLLFRCNTIIIQSFNICRKLT